MKKCVSCRKLISDEDVFCTFCGAKQTPQTEENAENNSLFLKYSGYLDNEALFKVAWAKEKGLIKSDFPNEAEVIYQMLALKGHLESMFRYAMQLLAKDPPDRDNAEKWLGLAAKQGHTASRNYLETTFYDKPSGAFARQEMSQTTVSDGVPAPVFHEESRSSDGVLSGAEIFARMSGSVVEILATTDGKNVSCASGFVVSSNGFVVTNAHAVLDEHGNVFRRIHAKTATDEYEAMPVAIGQPATGKNDAIDIALLYVKGLANTRPATLGDSDTCENGQKVYLIGNSLGDGICITSGIVSDKHRAMEGLSYPYVMTDAAANHGNSGGPLLNERGEVIGVLVSGIESAEGMNFTIPINVVKSFLGYVLRQTKLSYNQCAEMGALCYGNENMAFGWDNILSGIKIALDVIALLINIL